MGTQSRVQLLETVSCQRSNARNTLPAKLGEVSVSDPV